VVDLPGYGDSLGCTPYTLEHIAAKLAHALPQQVSVCGWSLGGQVALTWAQHFPAQVQRLVLVATTPCFANRADWPHGIAAATLQEFEGGLQQDYEGTLKRFLSLQARSGDDARTVMAELRQSLFARGRPPAEVLRAGLEILLDTDLRPTVASVVQPTLLIHGDHDALVPLAAAEWLHTNLPHGSLEVVHGCAHAPFLSHQKEFVKLLTDFLHG